MTFGRQHHQVFQAQSPSSAMILLLPRWALIPVTAQAVPEEPLEAGQAPGWWDRSQSSQQNGGTQYNVLLLPGTSQNLAALLSQPAILNSRGIHLSFTDSINRYSFSLHVKSKSNGHAAWNMIASNYFAIVWRSVYSSLESRYTYLEPDDQRDLAQFLFLSFRNMKT